MRRKSLQGGSLRGRQASGQCLREGAGTGVLEEPPRWTTPSGPKQGLTRARATQAEQGPEKGLLGGAGQGRRGLSGRGPPG